MQYLISILIGALLGSFPTAWFILKHKHGKDITREGSGNVGAMNSYEVTNSKITGITVLIIDLLKGALSVFLCLLIWTGNFTVGALALIMAVFTHCFNPWLKFKGGRGLATAAGGGFVLFPVLPILWMLLYLFGIFLKRNIHFGNVFATVFSLIVIVLFADQFAFYAYPKPQNADYLVFFTISLLIIVLIRHFEPIVEMINNMKKNDLE